ncbi:MAG: hypothetical protein AUH79_07500 [Betaproteobacteria bacterium 13_1_40CM_4_64_4]|nr:MAG: hypothetical protein AUH79_07500 [Betaproteobacteria bacterium 13_1_40CM_4_64_4]
MPAPATAIPFVRRDARRGMAWLRRAYAMFRAAPLPWLLLLLVYYALVVLAELGPWPSVGKLAASILKPVFAVGFLAAAWSQERGGRPRFGDLFRGFRSNLRALLPLGVVFFIGMTFAVGATALIDGGALIAWVSGAEEPSDELLQSGRLQLAMLFGIACALPTLLALWFAPALVVFHDAGAMTALATSLRASLANWRPTGIFGLAVLFYGGVLPALGGTLARALGATDIVALGLLLPYMLVFLGTFHIADYVAYRDVFHPDEPAPSNPETER